MPIYFKSADIIHEKLISVNSTKSSGICICHSNIQKHVILNKDINSRYITILTLITAMSQPIFQAFQLSTKYQSYNMSTTQYMIQTSRILENSYITRSNSRTNNYRKWKSTPFINTMIVSTIKTLL